MLFTDRLSFATDVVEQEEEVCGGWGDDLKLNIGCGDGECDEE